MCAMSSSSTTRPAATRQPPQPRSYTKRWQSLSVKLQTVLLLASKCTASCRARNATVLSLMTPTTYETCDTSSERSSSSYERSRDSEATERSDELYPLELAAQRHGQS